jgi:ubiquinone/menaquinone biosynthesis C-methylase UbiE
LNACTKTNSGRRSHYDARARWFDWANRFAALLRGTSGKRERRKAMAKLGLKPGPRVLEVCVGTGTNLPLMRDLVEPGGSVAGLDISRPMLERCRRHPSGPATVTLVEGEAAHLPFADGAFDAVLQHGGLAEFGDRRGAIAEMAPSPGRARRSCSATWACPRIGGSRD